MKARTRIVLALGGLAAIVVVAIVIAVLRGEGYRELPGYAYLLGASEFDVAAIRDGVGWDAVALREILNHPDADAAFKSLLREATLPGQLYALCGLYHTDPDLFSEEIEKYRHRTERIKVGFNRVEEVRDLVESRSSEAIRLTRGQTMSAWRASHGVPEGVSLPEDIAGGALPMRLAGNWRAEAAHASDLTARHEVVSPEMLLDVLLDDDFHPSLISSTSPWILEKKAVRVLAGLLDHDNPTVRSRAAAALGSMPDSAAVFADEIAELLLDEDPGVRNEAARALLSMGPWSIGGLPGLERALFLTNDKRSRQGEREEWLYDAFAAVYHSGAPNRRKVFQRLLTHPEAERRRLAVLFLGALEDDARPSLPALLRAIEDPDDEVRCTAVAVVAQLESGRKHVADAVRVVRSAIDDRSSCVRGEAAKALWSLERDAKTALPYLLRALDTTPIVGGVKASIREALVHYPDGLVLLVRYIGDKEKMNRSVALEILARLGGTGPSAESVVRDLLADPDSSIRLLVRRVAEDHPSPDVRWRAKEILEEKGSDLEVRLSSVMGDSGQQN